MAGRATDIATTLRTQRLLASGVATVPMLSIALQTADGLG